jgi:hypothetical protein
MKRLLWTVAVAGVALAACDPKKAPNPPSPKTAMQAVAAATPASDPSLPDAATALAQSPSSEATATR